MKVKIRKIRVSWFSAFLGISLVLFLCGALGLFLLHASAVEKKIKESLEMDIYFKDEAKLPDMLRLKSQFENKPYVIKAVYVPKEEGLKQMQKSIGEKPEDILGFNPLPNAVDINFKAEYVSIDSLEKIKKIISQDVNVREVDYDDYTVKSIAANERVVSLVLLAFAILVGSVSIAQINNVIALSLYSRRFVINSMQMVGATRGFIRAPFVYRGVGLGLLCSIFACALLAAGLYILDNKFPVLMEVQDATKIALLFACVIILGITISGLSSYIAVSRYLRMKLDDLF